MYPPYSYQVHKQLGWRKPSVGMAARVNSLYVYTYICIHTCMIYICRSTYPYMYDPPSPIRCTSNWVGASLQFGMAARAKVVYMYIYIYTYMTYSSICRSIYLHIHAPPGTPATRLAQTLGGYGGARRFSMYTYVCIYP